MRFEVHEQAQNSRILSEICNEQATLAPVVQISPSSLAWYVCFFRVIQKDFVDFPSEMSLTSETLSNGVLPIKKMINMITKR